MNPHGNETPQGMKDKSLEDVFYEQDVRAMEVAFEGQMHFGTHRTRDTTHLFLALLLLSFLVWWLWTGTPGNVVSCCAVPWHTLKGL
jgi:hypothetical protein